MALLSRERSSEPLFEVEELDNDVVEMADEVDDLVCVCMRLVFCVFCCMGCSLGLVVEEEELDCIVRVLEVLVDSTSSVAVAMVGVGIGAEVVAGRGEV